jgi:antitoxin component of RelBE/YafQ-DinJ toxin-antitoxin module
MDNELVSFRIEATLRHEASLVCASLGMELNDYLRACVTRLVQDKRIPFAVIAPMHQPVQTGVATSSRLWAPLEATTDVEAATICAHADIAAKTASLSNAKASTPSNKPLIKHLSLKRGEAMAAAAALRTDDPQRCALMLRTFEAGRLEIKA